MKKRTGIIVAAILVVIGLGPALAGPVWIDPPPDDAIEILEIELSIRIDPQKMMRYRIHVAESAEPARTEHLQELRRREAVVTERTPSSPDEPIKEVITVVRAVRRAAVSLIKYWLSPPFDTPENR